MKRDNNNIIIISSNNNNNNNTNDDDEEEVEDQKTRQQCHNYNDEKLAQHLSPRSEQQQQQQQVPDLTRYEMIDQWDRQVGSIETLQSAAKQLSGSSSCSSLASSSPSHSPLRLATTSSTTTTTTTTTTTVSQSKRLIKGECEQDMSTRAVAPAPDNSGNRNSGSANQNCNEEEPEQLHEKLEPSTALIGEQQVAERRSGADNSELIATKANQILPEANKAAAATTTTTTTIDDDDDNQNDQECLGVGQQHDAAPARLANTVTSLFAHVDKVRREVDHLLEATNNYHKLDDGHANSFKTSSSSSPSSSLTTRRESASTSWRQVMLNQAARKNSLDNESLCSSNATQFDRSPGEFNQHHSSSMMTTMPMHKQVALSAGHQNQLEVDEMATDSEEEEELRSKWEDAQKRTNALIMIDCLTKKRNELRSVDEKLHRMLRECLQDFDISRAGSPSIIVDDDHYCASLTSDRSADVLHNDHSDERRLHNKQSEENNHHHHHHHHHRDDDYNNGPNLEVAAIDLSKIQTASSSTMMIGKGAADHQISGTSVGYVPQSTTCGATLKPTGEPATTITTTTTTTATSTSTKVTSATINLKKSRLLGAVLPESAAIAHKQPVEDNKIGRSASMSLPTEAPLLERQPPADPLHLPTGNRCLADLQATSAPTAKMMMMMMTPATSPATSQLLVNHHHHHQQQQQRQHHNHQQQQLASFVDKTNHPMNKRPSCATSPRPAENLGAISQVNQLNTIFSPVVDQSNLSGHLHNLLPGSDTNEEEILLRPTVKKLCLQSVDERLKAAMATMNHNNNNNNNNNNNYINTGAQIDNTEIADLRQIGNPQQQQQQQQQLRRYSVSDYVHRHRFQSATAAVSPSSSPSIAQSSDDDQQHLMSLADCVDLRLRMIRRASNQYNGRYYSTSSASVANPADKTTAAYIFAAMQQQQQSNTKPHQQVCADYHGLFQGGAQTSGHCQLAYQQINLSRDGHHQHEQVQLPLMIGEPSSSGGSSSNSNSTHRQHLGDVHKMAFRCHVCGSGFEDRHRLQQHLSIHLNLHPSWFEEKTIKETLAQYESKRGDYFCSICNVRFETTAEFDKHMQLHGDKPHRCELCNQDNKLVCFRYYRQLLTHLRSHCFLYSCRFVPECKQTSNRKDYLKLHILKHHLNNQLPEQYTICCH